MIKIFCGWCRKVFELDNSTNKDNEYPIRVCSNCGRLVNASIKELTGNLVGRKHTHFNSKYNDIKRNNKRI